MQDSNDDGSLLECNLNYDTVLQTTGVDNIILCHIQLLI